MFVMRFLAFLTRPDFAFLPQIGEQNSLGLLLFVDDLMFLPLHLLA